MLSHRQTVRREGIGTGGTVLYTCTYIEDGTWHTVQYSMYRTCRDTASPWQRCKRDERGRSVQGKRRNTSLMKDARS